LATEVTARTAPAYFGQGFPISAEAHRVLALGDVPPVGSLRGPAQTRAARVIADRLNDRKSFDRPDIKPARSGELMATHVLLEILRHICDEYSLEHNLGVYPRGRERVRAEHGPHAADGTQNVFVDCFPPQEVLDDPARREGYLTRSEGVLANPDLVTREALLLRWCNLNPALRPYALLHDERALAETTPYKAYQSTLTAFLEGEPPYPETGLSLWKTLLAPMEQNPDDIEGQLDYVRDHWSAWLPAELVEPLLLTRGMLREERAMRGPGPGAPDLTVMGRDTAFGAHGYPEVEAFSADVHWMPNVVLMAKTVYVWLDQLSKRYGLDIYRLDHIPDEELDQLARWGVTGLWLIGLWERSSVSRDIKRHMGNPEAEASAYSLYDYQIAYDLGGEYAYRNLADRAWRRGIRLASDMVPNHVGIFSRWIVEHPDWFLQSDHPPFPGYTYGGGDLSPDGRVSIHIEDGYWNHSDAAVTFKLHDHRDGRTRYIYHGNDGTSMPWNDTAQLNYLLPEVREAVVQTILHVARQFPIIRFDAAMTLAKKHYQRLWFPKPGDAGAIPSRAEHGMTQEEFDRLFPKEFWREVVDRVAVEAPETLLLAEAFWLMEGYFVRTLGMHRVYNSAFMNMLKLEENAKYRQTIKNVLEYSPAILQRFVNFMNNPDEETAEFQFGKGDKYFCCTVMLATMPGLPMLGHGQIEGLTEKYGMEYRKAYKDESIDIALVERHDREIFPLLRRRYLFSGSDNFAMFDFHTTDGGVDENVFAYTNRAGHERALVVCNNAHHQTHGTLLRSTAINDGPAEDPRLKHVTIAEALALDQADNCYYIYRDSRTGLEHLEHAGRLAQYGLYLELYEYGYAVFLDWREVRDFDHSWGRLHMELAGRGVPSIDDAYMEMVLAPLLEPFRAMLSEPILGPLVEAPYKADARKKVMKYYHDFLERAAERCGVEARIDPIAERALHDLDLIVAHLEKPWKPPYPELAALVKGVTLDDARSRRVHVLAGLLRHIGAIAHEDDARGTSAVWMHEWFLTRQIERAMAADGLTSHEAAMDARLVRLLIAHTEEMPKLHHSAWGRTLENWAHDRDLLDFLHVNWFNGRRWLNREQLEQLLDRMMLALCIRHPEPEDDPAFADELALALDDAETIKQAAEDVSYDFDWLMESLK